MTPGRLTDLARALALVRPISRRRLYWTARAVLVSDPTQVGAFDRVFGSVFGDRRSDESFDLDAVATIAVAAPPDGQPRTEHRDRERRAGRDPRARPVERRGRRPRPRGRGAGGDGQRRGAPGRQELRRARALRARPALPPDDAPAARDAAPAHTPLREGPPRPARRPAPDAARQPAHRRRPDPPRAPPAPRRPPPAGDAVRHLGLDGALRPRLPAVPDLRGRQRAERRGVRVRHAADPADARAVPRATPSAPSSGPRPPRRTGRAGRGSATRSRRSTTATGGAAWPAAR